MIHKNNTISTPEKTSIHYPFNEKMVMSSNLFHSKEQLFYSNGVKNFVYVCNAVVNKPVLSQIPTSNIVVFL